MKSRFSIIQAFLIPGISLAISFGLAVILLFAGLRGYHIRDNTALALLGAGIVLLLMAFALVRHYAKLLNEIEIRLDGILIKGVLKRQVIVWSEVTAMNLTGKEPETFLFFSTPMEAFSILTKDRQKVVVLTKYYTNMDRIRTALHFISLKMSRNEQITSECFQRVLRTQPSTLGLPPMPKYGGKDLISLNGFFTYGCIALTVWIMFSNFSAPLSVRVILVIIILLTGPGFHGFQLHYFRMNDEYLVVKNHVWMWRQDAYLIKDIREIVFEEPYKMSTSLRVITNNYESKLYPAGSIRGKGWRELSAKIRSYGIKVRDEAFIDIEALAEEQ